MSLKIPESLFATIAPLIKGVIHIGAHYGQEQEVYKRYGIQNCIYFEPVKSSFEILKNNIKNEGIVVNKALGNENKKIIMNVERCHEAKSSSILTPKLHLDQYPWIEFTEKEEVDMIRLDDCEYDLSSFNFINIDTQGYELEVFSGAIKTLDHIDFLLSEVNRAELYENCAKYEDVCAFLLRFGFKIREVNWAGDTWGDALFIKEVK